MDYRSSASFPPAAVDWLSPTGSGRVLAIGRSSAATAARFAGTGCQITLTDKAASEVQTVRQRYPGLRTVTAAPDALPFASCSFDQVLIGQGFHLLPPGLALAEFARVLAPGGRLALLYTVRDDTVPWVRRLAAILRSYDPEVMSGDAESASVEVIADSPHFPHPEHRSFRLWVPISREQMLEMVTSRPSLAELAEAETDQLLAAVSALYESSAKRPDPLLLPYSVHCWRAEVDHSELTSALRPAEDGLQISLRPSPAHPGEPLG